MANTNFPQQPCLDRISQAYDKDQLTKTLLLTGTKGIGKYLLAQHIAAHILKQTTFNEQNPGTLNAHPDFIELKPLDKATVITIDQVRALQHTIQQTTHSGKARVVLILPAESMNATASNALLKTLEAPDSHTYFILISHTPRQLLSTVKSRCHEITLYLPSKSASRSWLQQTLTDADPATIDLLLHFSFARPSLAIQLHQHQQLADYQTMYANIVDFFAHKLSDHGIGIIDDATTKFSVFKDCYKRFIIDCIYTQHQSQQQAVLQGLPKLPLGVPTQTLNLCWQHMMALESILNTTPTINLTLNLYMLLAKLTDILNLDTRHATG